MVKYVSVICRPPGTDRQETIAYWLKVHAPLVRRALAPDLRKYVINLAVQKPGATEPSYDAIVELHFDDMDSMNRAMANPAWQSEERKKSSDRVIDYSRTKSYIVEENIIPLAV